MTRHDDNARPDRWAQVLPLLHEFQTYLGPRCRSLEIRQATDKQWTDDEYRRFRPEGFPSRMRGVYLPYDAEGWLIYVGLAMFSFDTRVWSHDVDMPRGWIDVVPFDDDTAFLAPALEFFLISKLKPTFNKVYRDY